MYRNYIPHQADDFSNLGRDSSIDSQTQDFQLGLHTEEGSSHQRYELDYNTSLLESDQDSVTSYQIGGLYQGENVMNSEKAADVTDNDKE